MPVDTYKIQLEPIKNVEADRSAKELAINIAKLNNLIVSLEQALKKSVSSQERAQKTGGADPRAIRAGTSAAKQIDDAVKELGSYIKHLSKDFKDIPKAITNAIEKSSETINRVTTAKRLPETQPELKALTSQLIQLHKNIGKSETYQTGKKDVYDAVDKLIKELSVQNRDISKLAESVRSLSKAVGVKEPPKAGEVAKPKYVPTTDAKLFGKALKDMGGEFENIKRELKDKIVVAIDLETSAAKFGKDAAANFITQIAYQKGTLSDLMSGKAETKSLYIKPPAKTKAEYTEKLTTLPSGKAAEEKVADELKRIAIPFEKLTGKGSKEIGEALSSLAEALKDAEVVLGHNIAEFDLRILQQHFDKAGITIDSAVDKFVDTVKLARHNFPERMGKNFEFEELKPHGLERFDKDLQLAGVGAKELGESMHDASTDLKVNVGLLKALDKSTGELTAVQSNVSAMLDKLLENIAAATQDAYKNLKSGTQKVAASCDSIEALSKDVKAASKSIVKQAVGVENLARVKSALQTRVYKETVLKPKAEAGQYGIEGPAAGEVGDKILRIWGDLAKSLFDLQKNMVTSLEKGMNKGLEIWRDSSGEAFKLGEGGREWEVKIADVRGLRRELSSTFREQAATGATPGELVKAFKAAFVRREMATPVDREDMASEVYKEIGSLTKESVAKMGDIVKELHKGIQAKTTTDKDILGRDDLQDLYKGVALEAQANRAVMERFVKSLTIPAAKVTPQGTLAFETKYGAEKALANFATITTGLEKLVKEMDLLGAPAVEVTRMMSAVGKAPLRPQKGTKEAAEAEQLAEELQKRVLQLGGREKLKLGYQRAVSLREVERAGPGEVAQKEALKSVADVGLEDLIVKAKELNVTALDVAKALDEIKFENFYDVLNKLFQAGKTPLLEKQAGGIIKLGQSERSLRKIGSVISDVMGLMPMIEPGQPKRREYDEQSLKVLTKAVSELRPEEQKKHIIDVGLLWKDIVTRTEKLGQAGIFEGKKYLGKPTASSLDLSDAASSALKQFNLNFASNLQSLDKTMTSMSLSNIRSLAPFQQFASIQRQQSYATSAISGGLYGKEGREDLKTPALVSSKEKALIESGRYGTGGYGLDVLTELRNTASTFEDQIVISGRLAKVFTEITGRLVRPAATYLEQQHITEMTGGVQRMTPRAAKMRTESEVDFKKVLGDVSKQFQEILGVPEKYRGRADIAEISDEIENIMREHRGRTIEVQTAKLTETFLNYFGRKLSTRFGTKGVSVTPTYGELPKDIGGIEDVAKFIKAGFKTGVATGPGLGVAKVPKSSGQMVSEIFEEVFKGLHTSKVAKELHDKLIDSGNKFVIEMFKDVAAGLVTEQEAKDQSELFERVSAIWKEKFGTPLSTGPAGIKEIRGAYQTERPDRETFALKPIEARISSKGIAKRGLMPEVLEGLVNNLIGSTSGTTTLIDEIGKDALTETKEARKRLNEYLEALGFEAFKDLDKVIENLKLPEAKSGKLKDWESQWKVYTEVVDEFGKKIQSFVAPKFLQIIEEPHKYKDWSAEKINKGVKGVKLDFQSFAAMAGVFGEGSSMLKELAASTSLTSKEGWELLKAFQMLDPAMKGFKDTMMKALPTVKLEDVKGFSDATGTVEDFKDTLFDIGKYPTQFKLRMPTAKGEYEEMPMPGASLRTTYREQLMGRGAPTNVARYLANLVDSAKAVEDLTAAAARGGMGLNEDMQRKFAATIRTELTTMLTNTIKEFRQFESGGALTPQNVKQMQVTIDKFKGALSTERAAPGVYQEGLGTTELEAVEAYEAKAKGKNKFSSIMSRISDILIGAKPESLVEDMKNISEKLKVFRESGQMPIEFEDRTPEAFKNAMAAYTQRNRLRGEAKKAFDVELEAGNLDEFAQKVGIDVSESVKQALQQKLESLSRAKISYFRELGAEVFGKKKGIEQTFFQRVTPAVTGKAVSAITDKTKELTALLNTLGGAKYDLDLDIPGIDKLIKSTKELTKEHKNYVDKAKKLGLPVLQEGEIAIPESQAAKIKVRTGKENEVETNLAELIKKQEKVFVESVRFPFTGTLSVQPHKAKLMESMGINLGKQAIAVPGAPQLDMGKLNEVVGTLKEYIGLVPEEKRQYLPEETLTLLQQREQAWAEGTEKGAEKATALTNTIEGLLKVVNDATPKFANLEQKLDFDGDALFVHTGQLEESRKEIGLHFKALGEEVTSVRNLFRSLFTAMNEGDVSTLVEMKEVFKKKHPEEKGFEFLTKPYIAKQMEGLDLGDVMGSLFSYKPESKNLEKGTDKWQQAVGEWSKGFVVKDILPEVFSRLGVTGVEREAYTGKVGGAKSGIPDTAGANELDRRISGLAGELVRRQLWEKKYSDAITGQLYKLHTGQTVEGVSRIARVSEIETGFGAGLAKTGKGAEPSEEFVKAFPKESIALGGRPVQEFATRVNEIMRFVIQKGMDVKHAGSEAVGQKIISNIGRPSGAEAIMKAMEDSREQFEELADFNDQITNEVKLRLGAVPTGELHKELKRFEPDTEIADLNINRQEIIQRIIKHVDLQAVFEELFKQIKRSAVKGLAKSLQEEAESLPPGTKKVKLMRDISAAGSTERLAEQEISKEAADKGISLVKYITTNLQPLYQMRTSMATMGTAAQRSGIKVEPTDMTLPAGQPGKDLSKQFEIAAKAANALSKAMESSVATPGRGIHTSMVVGALKQRYQDLEELQKLDQGAQKYAGRFEYAFTDVMDANKLAAKVWTESKELAGIKAPNLMPADYDVTGWLDQMNQVKKIAAQKLEEISEKAGLPPMVPEEKSLLAAGFESKFGARTFKSIKDVMGKGMVARDEKIVPEDLEAKAKDAYDKIVEFVKFQVSFVEQLRRVSEISKTVPTQKLYLREAFPSFDPATEFKPAFEGMSKASTEFIDKEKAVANLLGEYYKEQSTTRLSDIQNAIKTTAAPTATAAADELKKEAAKAADEITDAITKSLVERKRDALKYLESKAEGEKPARGALGVRTEPLFSTFRASGVQAGGEYGGGTQQEAIMKEMLGIKDTSMLLESTGFRGQAIHRNIQKEFVGKYPDAEIEQLMEDFENKITGHFDVLYEKSGQKILTDIKTVYSTKQFERLKAIADEVGKRNITIQQKLEELKASNPTSDVEKNVIRRLENYISQVNIYLKNTEGAIGELLIASTFNPEDRVTIPIGKFDPTLFSKDVDAINKSKAKVIEILKSISTTGRLPEDLLKEYPKIYKALSEKLEQGGVEEFKKSLPVQTLPMNIGKVGKVGASAKEVLGRLTENQQEQFDRLSTEYLNIFEGLGGPGAGGAEKYYKLWFAGGAGGAGAPPAAPPTPPPTGTGGGGFDDDDEFRKKIEKLLARIQSGIEPDVGEIDKLVRSVKEADDRATAALGRNKQGDDQLAAALSDLADRIRETIERTGGKEYAEKISKLYDSINKVKITGAPRGTDFGEFRTADVERIQPDKPEAIHKNLMALYEAAIRVNRLADSEEINKFGPDIAKLLTEAAEKGPAGISPQISEIISKLPPEKKGGMSKIWMLYKKAISDYFLKRLENLKNEIEKEGGTPEGRKAYMEYEQVLDKYLANIRGTIGRTSDIFTTKGPSGKKDQFVDPDIARLVGIYKSPKQIQETIKQSNVLSGEFQPIMDVLVGDLDPTMLDDIATPLEKIRTAFQMLTKEDSGMRAILDDSDAFRRIGYEAIKAWDFDSLVKGITQLRGGLQAYNQLQIGGFGGLGEDYTEQIRKNVIDTLNYLKQLEKMVSSTGVGASPMGAVGVAPFLDPKTQELLHKRNIVQVQKHFAKSAKEGGPEIGQAFTYRYKIADPNTKQVLSSMAEEFKKIGEETNKSGQQVGIFTQRTEDLVKSFQNKRGIGQAFGRVIRWGLASRTVYGLTSALQGMVNTIADVESGIAVLRQVMSPLETNFEQVTQAALDFAKQFGLPIRQVVDSMRVFAQQGLAQQEVIDRTRTSMLAANVTTLSTTDATEAITAAMKVYGQEGESTIRFLDSWAEVEAKHAITSMDLANGLKKAAAVAKTSGITFDQLNAIITGIGETSRQTGKEVGTSLRFMFRRIQADKAPKQLAQIGIPVIGESGELRSTFDILGDLSSAWTTMTNAQRLNIATAIGGRRHYNSLLILMDHWNDVLDTLEDSLNSKGASERRNAIVMDTYAKKLQQVRAAMSELQVQFGKFALPVAKTILTGLKGVLEVVANIPPGLKMAALGFAALFIIVAKGQNLISGVIDRIKGFSGAFGDLGTQFMKQFKIGIFETFGKLPKGLEGIDVRGLSSIGQAGKGIQDFESVLGKAAFSLAKFGRGWNAVMSEIAYTGTATSETISKAFGKIAGGLGTAAIKVVTKQPALAGVLDVMATGAKGGEAGFQKLGEMIGVPAEALAKWSQENVGFVKSVAPLAGSIAALIPVAGVAGDQFRKLAFSADGYEKSLSPLRRKLSSELAAINELSQGYRRLNEDIKSAAKASEPEATKTAIRREEYVSPILTLGKTYENSRKFANQLAKTNVSMIQGFDSLGNAVLKTTNNFEDYFRVLRAAKLKELTDTGVSALEKYAEELTNAGAMGSRFRSELKKFVGEVPGIGPLLAKQIQVSPAQELSEATESVNKILAVREKFPMTTAFDELFQRYLGDLEKVRTRYNEFYSDFKRVLADLPTEGLSAAQISNILDKETLQPAFELMLEFEGRLKGLSKAGKIDWKDILGTEILKRVHPEVSLDYAAPLTKEMLRQNKIVQRGTEAFAGDVVLFSEDIDKKFDIAGNQGILKYREGLGYFVEGIDKELRTVREIPFDTVRQFVDSVFPASKIADQLEENLDILRESLVGAAAGMVGITAKEFKQIGGLGPRFFEQIPTETLLQTSAGFRGPGGGYGVQPFKAGVGGFGFENIIKDYFIKPMKALEYLVEEPKKRLEAGEGFAPGFEEEIERYSTIIKNNQVIVQYMALFVDLNKSLAESARVLEENIAVEKVRNEILTTTAGLLKGFPESMADVNLGVRDFFQLTTQQRALVKERALPPEKREFNILRKQITTETIRRGSFAGEAERIQRAIVQLGFIRQQAEAAGVTIPREDLMSITESVIAGGTPAEGARLAVQKGIKSDTGAMVTGINDLVDALDPSKAAARAKMETDNLGKAIGRNVELLKNPRAIDRLNTAFGTDYLAVELKSQFDKLAKLRNLHEKKGNESVVRAIDSTMTESSRALIGAIGIRGAAGIISPGLPTPQRLITRGAQKLREPATDITHFLPGEFNVGNLISRALGGEGLREFRQRIEETQKGVTKEEQTSAKVIRGLAPAFAPIIGPLGYALARMEATSVEKGSYSRLKESPEFKELSTLMDDQNKISVTNSKTLTKLFFGYTAFNTIAKRASEREQKAYQIQIDQLKQQRSGVVVKYKADEIGRGDLKSQVQEINKEIIDLTRKAKEAGATSKERATREAVGVVAGAGTAFARALGVSEKALVGLGGTAASTIIAWNAWTALTGEKMPEVVKKATDAAKKWGDTLGKEGITWLDKLKIWLTRKHPLGKYAPGVFGAAGQATAAARDVEEASKAQKGMFTEQEKEKLKRIKDYETSEENVKNTDELLNSFKVGDIKKLDKDTQMLKINDDQLTTLLSIDENTRQTAEGTERSEAEGKKEEPKQGEIVKGLRSKLDELKQERLAKGGDTATKLKDLLAGAILVASGGYLAEKGGLSAELGEATRRAEKINAAFGDLVNKFPKEVEELIQKMQIRRAEMVKSAAETGGEVGKKSLLLDTPKLWDEFLNELAGLADRVGSAAIKSGEIIGTAQDKIHLLQTSKEIAKSIEDFAKTIIDASIDLETGLKLRTQTFGAMKGLPAFEEISMGKLPHELTATERLMKAGGPAWQDMYKTFKNLDNIRENLISLSQAQAKGIITSQTTLWADTRDQQQVIKSQRESIEKEASKFGPGKKAHPEFAKGAAKARKDVETYNKTIDPSLITKEIESKKSELDIFKRSSKKLVWWYREALEPKSKMYEPGAADVAGTTLGQTNRSVIQVKQQIQALQGLSTELGETELGKAASELRTKITEATEKLKMQVNVYKDMEGATKTVTELMERLHQVLATGLNIQQLIGDFEQMKASFNIEKLQQQFVEAADTFEQIRRGGNAPGAPVWPTFEMMQAGMSPEQMAKATKRDAALAAIVAQGRMPSEEDVQRLDFEAAREKNQYQQAKEDAKLNRQQTAAAEIHRKLLEAQRKAVNIEDPEKREKLISRFENIRTGILGQARVAGQSREEIAPGIFERYGYNFDIVEEGLKDIGKEFGVQGEELVKEIGSVNKILDQLGLGAYSPIVTALNTSNDYLKDIVTNTAKSSGIIDSLKELFKPATVPDAGNGAHKRGGAGGEFQTGGIITGPGGPRDDRVPIMASPGEFIVKASSAKRLGKSALEYINQKGRVPGFANGGEIPDDILPENIFKTAMEQRDRMKSMVGKKFGDIEIKEKNGEFIATNIKESFPTAKGNTDKERFASLTGSKFGDISVGAQGAVSNTKPIKSVHGVSTAGNLSLFKDKSGQWVITDRPAEYMPKFAEGGYTRNPGDPLMTPGALMHKRWMEKPEEYRTDETTPFQRWTPKVSKALVEKAPWLPLGEHVPEWAKKHPNLYGAFGAAKIFTPYQETEMALEGSELGLLSLAILPFLGLGTKAIKEIYKGTKLGGKSLLKLIGKDAKGAAKKPITKATVTGKYADEITKMVMETKAGQTNLGYALGIRAAEQDVKILAPMAKLRKQLNTGYEAAMKAGDFDKAALLGSKSQGMREGREMAEALIAIRKGKTPPINSATTKAIQYVEEGSLPYLPKLDFPVATNKGTSLNLFEDVSKTRAKVDILKTKDPTASIFAGELTPDEKLAKKIKEVSESKVGTEKQKADYIRKLEDSRAKLAKARSMADTVGIDIRKIRGLDKINVDTASIYKSITTSNNPAEAVKAWGEVVDQLKKISETVGPENLHISRIGVRNLDTGNPKGIAAAAYHTTNKIPEYGGIYFDTRTFANPLATRKKIARTAKTGYSAHMPPELAQKEAFRYLITHEAGHAFARDTSSLVGKSLKHNTDKFYSKYENDFIEMKEMFPSTRRVSTYSLKEPEELAAESFASAFMTPYKSALPPVRKLKDALGIKYKEGGWVDSLKDIWAKFMGQADPKGDTASAAEAIRRAKEREDKQKDAIKQIFDEKQGGGWIDDLRNILQGGIEGAKGTYKNILRAFTSPEGTVEREALTGELTKKRVEEALGEKITSYSQGTPFVPQTQLAMVHRGEGIIPAEYNMGGFVGAPKFLEGGGINPLKVVENAGEKIGEAIVKQIEAADLTLNMPKTSDLPTLQIGNLDDLRTILEGGAVGADRTSKLDQFIDSATNKLDRLEEQSVDNNERITIVEAQTSGIIEIGSLKLSISDLETKVSDVYTIIENKIDSDIGKSYMEARLHEIISDLKTDDILPIRSNIGRLELVINNLARDINNQYDIIYSNINRMDLK